MPLMPQIMLYCPAPWLRRPAIGYRAHFAPSRARSTSSTVGIITPRRTRQPDHRRPRNARARRNHRLDVFVFERAVLHLEPGVIVVLRLLAIANGIRRRLRKAEYLLPGQQ